MIRTDSRKRAVELMRVYAAMTDLKLDLVHSGVSNTKVKDILRRLENGQLDGIVCVDMLAEGFNFPRLKIAAIHAPHRSLEVTLQFIGRFARTNAPDVGEAKFVALLSEIEMEGQRLFDESAVWQDIIQNLSYARVSEEVRIREELTPFSHPEVDDQRLADLSLYSLHPRSHVKIYDVSGREVELTSSVQLPGRLEILYRNSNEDSSVAVIVARQRSRPKWSATDKIMDAENHLLVLYHDRPRDLLFINASEASEGVYESLIRACSPNARRLSMSEVMRVVRRLQRQRIFNYGVRNVQATNVAESYRITAGSDTQSTIRPSDAHLYRQGHVFMTGDVGGERVTIGYSSGSKVWSSAQHRIPAFLAWCRALASEIRDQSRIVTNSGLDFVPTGEVVAELPPNIVLVQWDREAFDIESPARVEYRTRDGGTQRYLLMDLQIAIDHEASSADVLKLVVSGPGGLAYRVRFGLSADSAELFEIDDEEVAESVRVVHGAYPITLIEYLNVAYPDMYTADGGVLTGNERIVSGHRAEPIDGQQLEVLDWAGTDIQSEVTDTARGISIHSRIERYLAGSDADVVFCDHGPGEIADFVALRMKPDSVEFALYHCKGSSGPNPGSRVKDVYEVCGQAQKSVIWKRLDQVERRLRGRLQALAYVRGDAALLARILSEAARVIKKHQVFVVQPGVSANALSRPLRENLGATSDHLSRAGFGPLGVIVSA